MQSKLRLTAAFIVAVLSTSVLASAFSSQFVIAALQGVGVEISLGTRFTMTLRDFAIFETLGLVTAACFFVGFIVAAICQRFIGGVRLLWFVVAGASALTCTLLLMTWQLQLTPIAGARTSLGLAFQALAGAIGGFLFAKLSADSTFSRD